MTGVLSFLLAATLMGAPAQAKILREEAPEAFEQIRHLPNFSETCEKLKESQAFRERLYFNMVACSIVEHNYSVCKNALIVLVEACIESEEL